MSSVTTLLGTVPSMPGGLRECRYSFVLKQGFCGEAEGCEPLHTQPELTQQRRGKQACIIAQQLQSTPPTLQPQAGSRVGWAAAEPCLLPASSPGPPPAPCLPIMPHGCPQPEEPGRAAASPHTQGSHMLAWPPGMQARVLPWHGARSLAWRGQLVAWQMVAEWGPEGSTGSCRARGEGGGGAVGRGSLAGMQEMLSWPCLWSGRHCRPGWASPGRGETQPCL